MAALDTKPVVGAGGGVYVAPALTAPPADFTALTAAATLWSYLGLISDDGVTYNPLEEDTQDMNVWQLTFPWDVVTTAQKSSLAFNLAQWNQKTVEFMFSGGTWTTAAGVVQFTPPDLGMTEDYSVFLHVKTSSANDIGVYYRRGKVTERQESNFKKDEMSLLGMTVAMLGTEGAAPQILYFNTDGMVVAP
jgi:hypothetical protein